MMKTNKRLAKRTKTIAIFAAAILMVGTLVAILPISRNWLKADAAVSGYDADKAAAYAMKYWQNYNSDYANFNSVGGDCANFVSQCLVAGGLPTTSTWGKYTSTWKLAPLLKDYLISIGGTFIENPAANQISVGDVLVCNYKYCNSKQAYDYGHIYICVKVENGIPWICSHNSDRYYSTYSMGYSKFAVIKMGGKSTSTSLTAPVVTTAYKYYAENAQVTVNWNAVSGATDYWFVIWKDREQIFSENIGNVTSYKINTTKGDYGIYVKALNGSTSSENSFCQFYAGVLEKPVPTTKSKYYAENAQVTVTWDACEGTEYYRFIIWKDGEQIFSEEIGDVTSYTFDTIKGDYEIYVQACNSFGGWQSVTSECCQFYAGVLEKPVPTTKSKYYAENAQVTVTWDACEGAEYYRFIIWKDGEQIFSEEIGDVTSYTFDTIKGDYEIYVQACNSFGGWQSVTSEVYNFEVLPRPNKTVLSANVNQSTKKVKFSWASASGADFYDLRVFQDNSTQEYKSIYGIKGNSYEFELPAGEYTANIASVSDKISEFFSLSDKIKFTVVPSATSVSLSKSSANVKLSSTFNLTAIVQPANTADSVTWKSSNTKIATVSASGQVKAVGLGRTTITATAGKVSASCTVDVVPNISLKTLGASIRISDPYGIRYGIQLKKDSAYKSTDIVEYGTLIIASGTLGGGELTIDSKSVRKIPAKVIYSEDSSQLTYTGVLINIPKSFFNTNVKGRGYLIYRDVEGKQRVMYSEIAEKNFNGVAKSAYDSYLKFTNPTSEQKAVIDKLKNILNNK